MAGMGRPNLACQPGKGCFAVLLDGQVCGEVWLLVAHSRQSLAATTAVIPAPCRSVMPAQAGIQVFSLGCSSAAAAPSANGLLADHQHRAPGRTCALLSRLGPRRCQPTRECALCPKAPPLHCNLRRWWSTGWGAAVPGGAGGLGFGRRGHSRDAEQAGASGRQGCSGSARARAVFRERDPGTNPGPPAPPHTELGRENHRRPCAAKSHDPTPHS